MASYDIGGEFVIGDFNVGYQEPLTSRYTSLGRPWYVCNDSTYTSRGNIVSFLVSQNAYIDGEMTVPQRLHPMFSINGAQYGCYVDVPNQIITYVATEDGTMDTAYSSMGESVTNFAYEGDLNFSTFLSLSDKRVYWTRMAFSQDLGVNLTWDLCNSNLASPNQGFALQNVHPVVLPNGQKLTTDDLEKEPTPSGEGGGNGSYDNDSDIIPFPSLPTLGAHNCGLLAVYNPTIGELQNFSAFLWSRDVFDTIKKFIASPMELIVSLAIVPVEPIAGNQTTIKIGGINTEVSSTLVGNQYMSFDCGTLDISEYYSSALDYGCYTRIHLYLPYIGVCELKTDEVMGGSVSIRYNIDLVSGSCVALVRCQRNGLNSVLYSYEGNIATQIPIASRDFSTIYTSLAKSSSPAGSFMSGGVGQAIDGGVQSAISVMSNKPSVQRSGSISSSAGLLGIHTPYVIIERPIQSDPLNSKEFYGRPSNITATLSEVHGYTECETDFLDISCTTEEMNMIRDKLSQGVIL